MKQHKRCANATKRGEYSPVMVIVVFVIIGITASIFLFGNDRLFGRQLDILGNEIDQYGDIDFAYDAPYLISTGELSVSYSNGQCWYCGSMRNRVDSDECSGLCCRSGCPTSVQILPQVPYFNQCGLEDNRRLCETACGPTSMKMAVGYYGHDASIHTLYREAGTYSRGTEIARLPGVAENYQLNSDVILAQDTYRTQDGMWTFLTDEIAQGNPVILSNRIDRKVQTCATNSGHYFLLVGIGPELAIINDPYTGSLCSQEVGNHIVMDRSYLFHVWNQGNYRAVTLRGQRFSGGDVA